MVDGSAGQQRGHRRPARQWLSRRPEANNERSAPSTGCALHVVERQLPPRRRAAESAARSPIQSAKSPTDGKPTPQTGLRCCCVSRRSPTAFTSRSRWTANCRTRAIGSRTSTAGGAPRPRGQRRARARRAAALARCGASARRRRRVRSMDRRARPGSREARRGGSCACTTCSRRALLGADGSLLASRAPRQPGVVLGGDDGLVASAPTEHIAMIVLNDHEEVGSVERTGAAGPFLEQVIERLVEAPAARATIVLRALAASACVSADNAHAVHPNYPERHEPGHRPIVNHGPAIKVNANQRYATSAATAAAVRAGVRRGRRAVAGVRVAEQHAVRFDDRADHRDPARHRHRRRRRAAAVDALRPRTLRRRRPRPPRRRPHPLPHLTGRAPRPPVAMSEGTEGGRLAHRPRHAVDAMSQRSGGRPFADREGCGRGSAPAGRAGGRAVGHLDDRAANESKYRLADPADKPADVPRPDPGGGVVPRPAVSSCVGWTSISIADTAAVRRDRIGPAVPGSSIRYWRTDRHAPSFECVADRPRSDSAAHPPAGARPAEGDDAHGRCGDSHSPRPRGSLVAESPSCTACSITDEDHPGPCQVESRRRHARVVERRPSGRRTTSASWIAAVRYVDIHGAIAGLLAGGASTWIRWSWGSRR